MMFQRFVKKVGTAILVRRVAVVVAVLLMLPTPVSPVSGSTFLGAGLVVVDAPSGPDVTTTSTNWADIPHMTGQVNLVDISDLAVTFCAEANVTNGKRMFVRALVDGRPSNPGDVVLAAGRTMDTHCFTFVKNGVKAGEYPIRMQWLVDSGGTAHVGDRTLHITFAQSNADELTLLAVAAPSGPDKVTTGGWTDIPDMSGNIHLSAPSDLAITFSAEVYATDNRRLFIQALVDGQPASPSDEVLVVGGYNGTRTFTFVKQGMGAGSHNVRVQWLVDDGGEGHVGDRTLKVVGVRRYDAMQAGRLMVAAPSGPAQTTTSTNWVDIPGLGGSIDVPAAGDIVIGFSAEIWASSDKRVFVRALVDGQPSNPSDVRLITGGWRGTYAFSFVKRNVSHGSHTIQLQWAVDSGGEAAVGDRTLTAYTFTRLGQTAWTQLAAIDSFTRPAILSLGNPVPHLSHSVGRIYTVAIAHNGHVYFTSRPASITDSPTGWDAWQSAGPERQFDPYTPPVLVGDGDTIYLFARGTDNNLYETHRTLSANWSTWQQLTSNGPVRGRLSVALTRPSGTLDVHAIYTSVNNTVEYRRFDSSWAQVGSTEQWSNALEGTITTDGVNEVWATIRTNDRRLLIEKKRRPWNSPWQAVTARLAEGNQGAFFDISNFVFFGEAYHIAYSLKYLCDDVSGAYCHSLVHTRIRTGQPDEGYVRFITDYTPQGDTHPQAELIVYRNKLVMAYKDHQGWVRYAYWDTADPKTPWIGKEIVASGRASHRPALATYNSGLPSASKSYQSACNAFGNDLLAAVKHADSDDIWFINFSRTIFAQRMADIGIGVNYVLDDPPPAAVAFKDNIYLFQLDRGRNIRSITVDTGTGAGAGGWSNLGGDFGATARPEKPAAVVFDGKLFLSMLHWDGTIYYRYSSDGVTWSQGAGPDGWQALAKSSLYSAGPVAAVFDNKIHVLTLTKEGIYGRTSSDGSTWTSGSFLPDLPNRCGQRPCNDYEPGGGTGALQAFDGRLHVFTRVITKKQNPQDIPERRVWHLQSDTNGSWQNAKWQDLGLVTPAAPEAAVIGGKLVVFAVDRWNMVWVNRLGVSWEGWKSISGPESRTPASPAAAIHQDELRLFVRGMDYHIRETVSSDGLNWSSWQDTYTNAPGIYGPFSPKVQQIPAFTEAGYVTVSLPNWMMNHIFKSKVASGSAAEHKHCADTLRVGAGGHLGETYTSLTNTGHYPIWVNFNSGDRIWCGAHVRFTHPYSTNLMHEVGHSLAGALGIYDKDQPPAPNLEPGISAAAYQQALDLFGRSCPPQSQWVAGRPRGFTGTYECTSRQHDWIELLRHYFSNGEQVRQWIQDDKQNGTTVEAKTLLEKKYNWMRDNVFRGVEFKRHNEPLVSP